MNLEGTLGGNADVVLHESAMSSWITSHESTNIESTVTGLLPSGNLLHSYWKWPFIVDLSSNNWFSIVMLVYQRVHVFVDCQRLAQCKVYVSGKKFTTCESWAEPILGAQFIQDLGIGDDISTQKTLGELCIWRLAWNRILGHYLALCLYP
jgi:hypothetical protein